MLPKIYIYCAKNKINNKKYIGQTNNLKYRLYRHEYDAIKANKQTSFCRAIRKYGMNNFEISVVQRCKNLKTANLAERKWIKIFKSNNNKFGYNLTTGGDKNKGMDEKTKTKLSNIRKGMKLNKKWVENIRESIIKRSKNKDYRKKLSEGHKKISDKNIIKIFKLWNENYNIKEISSIVGFNIRTIRQILHKQPKYMKNFKQFKPAKFYRKNLRIVRDDEWRKSQGISHGALFNESDIVQIFKLFKAGKTYGEIAEIKKTRPNTVGEILRKQTYVYFSRNL